MFIDNKVLRSGVISVVLITSDQGSLWATALNGNDLHDWPSYINEQGVRTHYDRYVILSHVKRYLQN